MVSFPASRRRFHQSFHWDPILARYEDVLDAGFDPGNRYSAPKDWGTTGVGYLSKFVTEDITTWKQFYDLAPKYSGKYVVIDSAPEVVGSALKMLGHSYNTLEQDLGGTYSVSAGYSNTMPSPGYGTSTISFGSSPENAGKLTDAVKSFKPVALLAKGPMLVTVANDSAYTVGSAKSATTTPQRFVAMALPEQNRMRFILWVHCFLVVY